MDTTFTDPIRDCLHTLPPETRDEVNTYLDLIDARLAGLGVLADPDLKTRYETTREMLVMAVKALK